MTGCPGGVWIPRNTNVSYSIGGVERIKTLKGGKRGGLHVYDYKHSVLHIQES